MAFIPTPACVQARVQYQETGGIVAENIFYHATTGVPTPENLEAIGAAWADWALESAIGMMTSNWKIISVALRAMNEAEGISAIITDGFPVTGDISGSPEPLNVSYTVTWSTGLVGRSARGRSYGVGLAREYIAGENRLTDTGQLAMQVRWNNLLNIMSTAGFALQVVSFQEGGVPRTEGRKLPILACNVRFPLATQRRRLT